MKAGGGNRTKPGAGLQLQGTSHRGTAAVSGQGRAQHSRTHRVVRADDEQTLQAPGERDGEEGTEPGRGASDA